MSQSPESKRAELPRVLGPAAAISCVVGSVIGSGIFIVPAGIAKNVPYLGGIALVWIVGGLFSLAGALTLAELGAMLPHAGGPYVYLREAYGRLPAFLFGWAEFLVVRAGSVATLAAGFALYFIQLVPAPGGMNEKVWAMLVAMAAMATVAIINITGTRNGGGVQVVGTVIKLAALSAMIILPFVMGRTHVSNLSPVAPSGQSADMLMKGFLAALISALWAYDGWVNAGAMAEDIANPGKNVPRALLVGMAILITVYLSMTLVYHLVLPINDVIRASVPGNKQIAAELCFQLWGENGSTAIALIVMSSIYIALNGNAMSGPRAYFAMARDGLFPWSLQKIHPKFKTPANAIIVQTVWAMALTLIGTIFILMEPPTQGLPGPLLEAMKKLHTTPLYDVLYTFVIFGGTIGYTLAISSVFLLRKQQPDLPRPYRTWGYPFTPILYIAASFILLGSMLIQSPLESFGGLIIIGLGWPGYLYFSRKSSRNNATLQDGSGDLH
jgi:APA family basic amino acid/polyamine antiporter